MGAPEWFIDRWPTPVRAGYGLAVVATATLFTLVFYASTAAAVYGAVLGSAIVFGGTLGSPFFVVAFVTVMTVIGLVLSLGVYAPLTLVLARLARRRLLVWFAGAFVVAVPAFAGGLFLASQVVEPDPLVRNVVRTVAGLALPWFLTGGYLAYWLVCLTLTQLLPRLVRRLEQG